MLVLSLSVPPCNPNQFLLGVKKKFDASACYLERSLFKLVVTLCVDTRRSSSTQHFHLLVSEYKGHWALWKVEISQQKTPSPSLPQRQAGVGFRLFLQGDKLTFLLNKEPIISSTFISMEKVSGTMMRTWWGLEMMRLCVRAHFPGESSVCSDATAHVNFIFESGKVPLQV